MKTIIKKYITLFIKGIGIGAANIIPGVSGGTIALITGIFEELVLAIKSININALKLLFTGRFTEFQKKTNFMFLVFVFGGAAAGIYALAFVLEPLFRDYPQYVWAFFFGLILASVFFVGSTIHKWSANVILFFIAGTIIAVCITVMLRPANENDAIWYVFVCGIVAICSMILPGLSGSYVLLLMGNWELVMIRSVKYLDMHVLIPLMLGAVIGLISFSHLLAWVFRKFKDHTIATLIGFIFGSLGILWPWKNEIIKILQDGREQVIGYKWYLPATIDSKVVIAVSLMVVGIIVIWLIEKLAAKTEQHT